MKFDILVLNNGKTKLCDENKHLMESLGMYSNIVPKGCHNGACGVCRIKVISGSYKSVKMNRKHISIEDEKKNILLACKVFPSSNMQIEFLKKEKKKHYCLGD